MMDTPPVIHYEQFDNVQYISNYDGDTIAFTIPSLSPILGNINVRIKGIDTPEIRTRNTCEKQRGYIAKMAVRKRLMMAKKISLKNCTKGKYFRLFWY